MCTACFRQHPKQTGTVSHDQRKSSCTMSRSYFPGAFQLSLGNGRLKSEAKCNTPGRFDIGKVDQDLEECCDGILYAPVVGGERPAWAMAHCRALDGRDFEGVGSSEIDHLLGAAAERAALWRVFSASRRRSLSIAPAA